jgi:hypothetical protein
LALRLQQQHAALLLSANCVLLLSANCVLLLSADVDACDASAATAAALPERCSSALAAVGRMSHGAAWVEVAARGTAGCAERREMRDGGWMGGMPDEEEDA